MKIQATCEFNGKHAHKCHDCPIARGTQWEHIPQVEPALRIGDVVRRPQWSGNYEVISITTQEQDSDTHEIGYCGAHGDEWFKTRKETIAKYTAKELVSSSILRPATYQFRRRIK